MDGGGNGNVFLTATVRLYMYMYHHFWALEVGVAHQGNLISAFIVVSGQWVWLESVGVVCVRVLNNS